MNRWRFMPLSIISPISRQDGRRANDTRLLYLTALQILRETNEDA
jgi:hypothetical protein